jgi:membrane associated rhomboid family serine protease
MRLVIEKQEFWRLFSALLLHGNFMHLMVRVKKINVFSQLRLCFSMEKFYKVGRFVIIYLLAGLGGNLLSGIMYPENVLVGSSASLFGIFGCFGCYFVYNWHSIGPGRNLSLLIYLFFVVISLELPITLASIEIIGHLGGYVVGFSLGFFLLPKDERNDTWDMIRIVNGIAVLVYFAVMVWFLSILINS